jgi:hypothetical protein
MTRRWLGSADVEIDDTSGALLVKLGDVDLQVDIGDLDISSIIAGIAGSGAAAKTLADVVAALANLSRIPASPATEAGNLATIAGALAGSYRVNEGGTGTGRVTIDSNALDVVTVATGHTVYHCRYSNGSVAGQISFDNGATWDYLAANASGTVDGIKLAAGQKIQIKRIGSNNMISVFVTAWGV